MAILNKEGYIFKDNYDDINEIMKEQTDSFCEMYVLLKFIFRLYNNLNAKTSSIYF